MLSAAQQGILGFDWSANSLDPAPELIPSDPYFGQQWYLHNTTSGQYDLNVTEAWNSYSGEGVLVTAIDDGFRYTHQDLAANYDTSTDYDYEGRDYNPMISSASSDYHGTPVIGIIIGQHGNGIGGVGVAHGATLRGYKGFTRIGEQILDAAGLGNGSGNGNGDGNGGDIVSMSFGYGRNVFISTPTSVGALETASEFGRGGLGQIHVKSNGNSRAAAGSSSREEATAEAMDSSKHTINVAALRADGWVTDFSSPGANLLVSAFADNTSNFSSIRTTTANGDNTYTSAFGGTSAAAPQVTGVVALMLEANDQLGWRDVQMILAASARQVGSDVGSVANSGAPGNGGHEQASQLDGSSWFWNGSTFWNGGGMHFSNDYGYGLVDALAAVRLAQTWTHQSTTTNETEVRYDFDGSGTTVVPDGNASGLTFMRSGPSDMRIDHVSVDLNFTANRLADLELFLTSAQGTRVQLLADTGDSASFSGSWSFGTTAFMGEISTGTWTLQVVDDQTGQSLNLHDADVVFSGTSDPGDANTLILTNAFSDFAHLAGRSDLAGGAGQDTVNASAVNDSASTVNLGAGSAQIDGVDVTLSSIEHFFSGDGDDLIYGSNADNILTGGRGDDTIQGNGGSDRIEGGAGSDWVSYTDSRGSLRVDLEFAHINTNVAAGDTYSSIENLIGSQGFDNLRGTFGDNIILGNSNVDYIFGRRGDDRLDGGIGDDVLFGGVGEDVLIGADHRDRAQYSESLTAVLVDLANPARNTGEAAGDSYLGIEDLAGSAFGDQLYGDGQNNRLFGREGADRLIGQQGADYLNGGANGDWLEGGAGDDILRGGTHADTFVFSEGRDRIEDFSFLHGDVLAFDRAALGLAGFTATDVVLSFGDIEDSQVVFDFGDDNRLTLESQSSLLGFEDGLVFV